MNETVGVINIVEEFNAQVIYGLILIKRHAMLTAPCKSINHFLVACGVRVKGELVLN